MSSAHNTKYRVKGSFIIQIDKNKLTIFDPDQSKLFTLNEVAAAIFQKLKDGHTPAEIKGLLHEKYDVQLEDLDEDIAESVAYLMKNNLICRR